ncbi:enoyl-CoA-hydratase DpgB [Micromonospora orduensis]|uniref:enoyl-CoA-hydratase DpgB n=1 Tax=Micromonospora orduensis TaxID=1420891 RepID=UPI00142EF813|nr:enoyl-CoA-hydratase DpgB [Micromonospora orduensis]
MPEIRVTVASGQPATTELIAALTAACAEIETSGAQVALVLRIVGAPAHLADSPSWSNIRSVNRWERLLRRIERLGVPVLAVADGVCTGPAAEALLVADHRVVAADFVFQLDGDDAAAWPSMAIHRLGQQLGVAAARPMVLFRTAVHAREAVAVGLVDEVAEDLAAAERAVLDGWYKSALTDVGIRRALLLESAWVSPEVALGAHLAACDRTLRRAAGDDPAGSPSRPVPRRAADPESISPQ